MSYFLPPEAGERLPVSLITGFLGTGKTTLRNRLLRHPHMANTAVVINGCLCCDVRRDLEGVMGTPPG